MLFNTQLRVNGKALETFGYEGGGNAVDRFGLLTDGLVWQVTSLWTGLTASITTIWIPQDNPYR